MNKHVLVAVVLTGIAACTTSGPVSKSSATIAQATGHESDIVDAEIANESADTMRASATPDIADENSIYCRKEKLTGTRIAQVVCMTPAEKERIREISRMNADAAKRSAGAVPQQD